MDGITKDNFPHIVKDLAYELRMPMNQMADILEVSPVYLSQLVNGHKTAGPRLIKRFTEKFGNSLKHPLLSVHEAAPTYGAPPEEMTYTISDSSMTPHFQVGDQVVYNASPMPYLVPGKPYLVFYGSTKMVRYVFRQDEKIILKAESNWFTELSVDPGDCKLYELVSLIRKLD